MFRLTLGIWLVLGCLNSRYAWSTTVVPQSLQQLTDKAVLIAIAEAQSKTTRWQGGRIMTDTQMRIKELWKGHYTKELLSVTTLGGIVGEIGQYVPGSAQLSLGAVVLVFLVPGKTTGWRVVAMGQGVLPLRQDRQDLEIARPQTRLHGPIPPAKLSYELMSLTSLKKEILQWVAP
jgi:hypothetical protein